MASNVRGVQGKRSIGSWLRAADQNYCDCTSPSSSLLPCAPAASHIVRMLDTFLKSPIPLGYAQRIAAGDYSTEARWRLGAGCWVQFSQGSCLQGRQACVCCHASSAILYA